jgi:hypothetical protein
VSAPYGKLYQSDWGPSLNNKVAWFIMEAPTVIFFLIIFFISPKNSYPMGFLFWMIHYGQRTFIFPWLIRGKSEMPILIMGFGFFFNLVNTYIQSRWLFKFSPIYRISWLISPFFIIGIISFFLGYIINLHSDYIIRNLREPGDCRYKIPHNGLYKYVSCPNYLGEIIEWIGWAIMIWAIPGFLFAFWTFANLAPRALANHQWYQKKFPNYPEERKALIPYVL